MCRPFQGALDGGNFYGSSEQDLGRNAQISYTRVWSPTIISETRVGVQPAGDGAHAGAMPDR